MNVLILPTRSNSQPAYTKEQFAVCLHWVNESLTAHKDVIGMYNIGTIDANTLTAAIRDVLLRMNLAMAQCCGQCYDGASNMASSKHGVAAQRLAEEPRALLTHCYGHALNLAVADAMKQSKVCRDALDTAFEISQLIRFSPKRNAASNKIKVENPAEDESGPVASVVLLPRLRISYLRPLVNAPVDPTLPWFSQQPIRRNKLNSVMKTMSAQAGLSLPHTNHSLRTYGATKLFQENVPEKVIQDRTGHLSTDALQKYECISEKQKLTTLLILNNSKNQTLQPSSSALIPVNSQRQAAQPTVTVQKTSSTKLNPIYFPRQQSQPTYYSTRNR